MTTTIRLEHDQQRATTTIYEDDILVGVVPEPRGDEGLDATVALYLAMGFTVTRKVRR